MDPQCPLGGPDGLKDVLCIRGGVRWLAAAYFPTTTSSFRDVVKKFKEDFIGVRKHSVPGFTFLTNQRLTPGERAKLIEHAERVSVTAEVYHLERLRGILDTPKGYGIRLEYLRILMSEEEQISFFSALNYDVTRRLLDNEKQVASLHEKLDLVLQRTTAIGLALTPTASSIGTRTTETATLVENPTSTLSIGSLCWLHRIVTEGSSLPDTVRGRLRSVSVLITSTDYTPVTAEQVHICFAGLCLGGASGTAS